MRRRHSRQLVIIGAAIAAVVVVHVLLAEVVKASEGWVGGVTIAGVVIVVVALHVAGFRRLAARRKRETP